MTSSNPNFEPGEPSAGPGGVHPAGQPGGGDFNESLDLDTMPVEALSSLLQIEVPRLFPTFGVVPDRVVGYRLGERYLWERLLNVMDNPVQVYPWRGDKKVVHVLRQWVLVVWANGRITALRWHAVSCGAFALEPVGEAELDLFQIGSRSPWYAHLRDATKWEYVQEHLDFGGKRTAREPRSLNSAVFLKLRRKVLAYVRSSRLDARIRQALQLDQAVMKLALSLVGLKRHPHGCDVRISSYNWVVGHQHALTTIRRDAPGLTQWFVLCAQDRDFPPTGEPVQRLKRYLSTRAVGRRGWLLMLQHSRHLLSEGIRLWGTYLRHHALDIVITHATVGGGQLVPDELFELLRQNLGVPNGGWSNEGAVLSYVVSLWRERSPKTPEELGEWHEVLRWFKSGQQPVKLNAYQRAKGLPYLLMRARHWQLFEFLRCLVMLKPLPVWHEPVAKGAWRLEFLRTAREMLDEGEAMSHCLGRTSSGYSPDDLYARVLHDGEHVGTAWFQQDKGKWRMVEAFKRANRAFRVAEEDELVALARYIKRPVYVGCGSG